MTAATHIVGTKQPKRKARSKPKLVKTRELSNERSWDLDEVAWFLHVSPAMVRKEESAGRLPAFPRIGRRVLWHPLVVRSYRAGRRGAELKQIMET